jgi:hypothetical protein
MNIEIAKKPTYKTLTLKSKKAVAQAVLDDSLSQDAQLPLTSKIPDFNSIYNELRSKFPERGFPRKGANFSPTCLNAFVHKACRG